VSPLVVDYLPKPFTPQQVRHAARRVAAANVLQRQISELQERLDETEGASFFETKSPSYHAFLQTAMRAAASDSVVLLRGESGTGKTVLAAGCAFRVNVPIARSSRSIARCC
jgi:NtrC-family two-component system response regulator AlgB